MTEHSGRASRQSNSSAGGALSHVSHVTGHARRRSARVCWSLEVHSSTSVRQLDDTSTHAAVPGADDDDDESIMKLDISSMQNHRQSAQPPTTLSLAMMTSGGDACKGALCKFVGKKRPRTRRPLAASRLLHSMEEQREYVETHVNPTLAKGLIALCREKPANPVEWLAKWLIASKPPPQVLPARPKALRALTRDELFKGRQHVSVAEFEQLFEGEDDQSEIRRMDLDGDGFISQEEWLTYYQAISDTSVQFKDETNPYLDLCDSSRRIVYNLLGFLRCRDEVEQTALAVLPQSYLDSDRFASFSVDLEALRQKRHGGETIADYDALVAHCEPIVPQFISLMRAVVSEAGLDPDAPALHNGKPVAEGKNFTALTLAPLKGRERCDEKAANEYDADYARIADCVRCSIIVDTEAQLMAVAARLHDAAAPSLDALGSGSEGGEIARFAVLRLKNRYSQPLFNGYRDALYSIALAAPGGGHVVCEVQVHLAAVLVHKKASHGYYEFFRSYFRGASDAIESRLLVLSELGSIGATSPDALMHLALVNSGPDQLNALDSLFGTQMLGDYKLQATVRLRKLELALETGDVRKSEREQELVAAAYWRQGLLEDAEPYCRACLETRTRDLGPDAKMTLDITNLLAHITKDKGDYDTAEPLYRRVFAARTSANGAAHLGTVAAANNLAVLLGKKQVYDEAESLFRDALAKRSAALGEFHRDTLLTTYLLAEMLELQPKRTAEAVELYEQLYEARLRSLGQEHVETRQTHAKLVAARKRRVLSRARTAGTMQSLTASPRQSPRDT